MSWDLDGQNCWLILNEEPAASRRTGLYLKKFDCVGLTWVPDEKAATVFWTWHRASYVIGHYNIPARIVLVSTSALSVKP